MLKFFRVTSDNNDTQERELSLMVSYGLKDKGTPIESVPYDVIVTKILSLLDNSTLGKVMQVNKFFSKSASDNRLWKERIKELLTEDPKFENNKHYYTFLSGLKLQLINLKNLFSTYQPKPESILSVLYEMACASLEKPFFAIINKFPGIVTQINEFRKKEHLHSTLAHAAASANNVAILNKLIEYNPDLNARCDGYLTTGEMGQWVKNLGKSVLQNAAGSGAYECLQILLAQKNILFDTSDCWNNTALHDASSHGYLNCVKLLVEKGASLNVIDNHNNTPYELAKKNKYEDVASYLAEQMRKQNIPVPEEKSCIIQ